MADALGVLKSKVMECHQLLQFGQESKAKKVFKEASALMIRLHDGDELQDEVAEVWYGSFIELVDWFNLNGIKSRGR